ncbi:MAG: hypothetical protein WCW54_03960 [Candidatus Paceibacterota bacterium]
MKTLRIFLFILIIIGIALILTRNIWVPKLVNKILERESKQGQLNNSASMPISIVSQKIDEENFSGTTSVISGASLLAVKMREYIDTTVSDFRVKSNAEVPDIRKSFGADSPSGTYEIDISSKYIKGAKTESIVTSVYSFTGGAHGSTNYKVMTASLSNGRILSLSDIVKKEKRNIFTKLVKEKLNKWIPEGGVASSLFADNISSLKFNSFLIGLSKEII